VTPQASKPKATAKRKVKAKAEKAGSLRRHGTSKHSRTHKHGKAKKAGSVRRHSASKPGRVHKRRGR
jgi:hypothetical protein